MASRTWSRSKIDNGAMGISAAASAMANRRTRRLARSPVTRGGGRAAHSTRRRGGVRRRGTRAPRARWRTGGRGGWRARRSREEAEEQRIPPGDEALSEEEVLERREREKRA